VLSIAARTMDDEHQTTNSATVASHAACACTIVSGSCRKSHFDVTWQCPNSAHRNSPKVYRRFWAAGQPGIILGFSIN